MKVFLSWSGDHSHAVATHLSTWLKHVIQSLEPWISTRDLPKGMPWDPEISEELNSSPTGVICLTKENLRAPWILFEAGALHKGLASRKVCTLLIGLKPTDVEPPLSKFNHTSTEREDMLRLVTDLNTATAKPLPLEFLKANFDTFWPMFASQLSAAEKSFGKKTPSHSAPRSSVELLEEVLNLTRTIDTKITLSQVERAHSRTEEELIRLIVSDGARSPRGAALLNDLTMRNKVLRNASTDLDFADEDVPATPTP